MAKPTDAEKLQPALRLELARAIADRQVPDDVVVSVSKQLANIHDRWPIQRLDICAYGICIDRVVPIDKYRDVLASVLDSKPRKVELFPWGIIDWDFVQIRAEHQVQDLASFVGRPGH